MQMAVDNIWLIRVPGCLVPRDVGAAHRALPAPSDGWLSLVGLSQRHSWVHSPPAPQSSNLSPTQDDLIIVMRLSLSTHCPFWGESWFGVIHGQPQPVRSLFATHRELGESEVTWSRGDMVLRFWNSESRCLDLGPCFTTSCVSWVTLANLPNLSEHQFPLQ